MQGTLNHWAHTKLSQGTHEFMVVSAALDIPRFPQEPPRLSWQKTPGHLAGFGICRLPNVAQRIFTRYRLALINKKFSSDQDGCTQRFRMASSYFLGGNINPQPTAQAADCFAPDTPARLRVIHESFLRN